MTGDDRTDRTARREERRRAVRRRRLIAAACIVGAVVAVPVLAGAYSGRDAPAKEALPSVGAKERAGTATRRLAASAKRATTSAPARPALRVSKRPSDRARLKLAGVISGNISPMSVASSGAGYVTAQNMMYRHSVTVYDAATLKLVKTISDSVNLPKLGYREYGTATRTHWTKWAAPTRAKLWVNHNKMLGTTPGTYGVKTGWTSRAGGCLVVAVRRGDRSVIGVVLASPSIWSDMAALLDVAFNRLG